MFSHHFFQCFWGWTWARFGLSHFFHCFSWARLGLDQGWGFGRTYVAASDHRLRRLGPLTTNVNVGMVEVGTFAF